MHLLSLYPLFFSTIAQLNVWTIIGVSQMRGQDIANKVLPGLGYIVAFLISLVDWPFNIGNIGGASMGPSILYLVSTTTTAAATKWYLGILLFTSKKMGGV